MSTRVSTPRDLGDARSRDSSPLDAVARGLQSTTGMQLRSLVTLCSIVACSNATAMSDGGNDAAADVIDSFDAPSDVAADAGAFTPAALDQANKLALWLEATSTDLVIGDGGGVTTWHDKSKNKNDAVGFGPLPVVDAGAQAGHDAVFFNQTNAALAIADGPSMQFATDPLCIIVVTRVGNLRMFWFEKSVWSEGGAIYYTGINFFDANGGASDASAISFSPYAAVDNQAGDSVTWGSGDELADGKFHIVMFRRTSATSIEVGVDDLSPRSATVAAVDVSVPGEPAYIGSPPQTPGPGTPDLAIAEEIIIHDSTAVTDADVANVQAYLKLKYSL